MLVLNKLNGELKFGNHIFNKETSRSELESLTSRYNIKTYTTTTGSILYGITDIDDGENALQFLFFDNKLQWINIYAGTNYSFQPFVITPEEISVIKKMLETLGGENLYSWGSVAYSEDRKGGIVSIIIRYKLT